MSSLVKIVNKIMPVLVSLPLFASPAQARPSHELQEEDWIFDFDHIDRHFERMREESDRIFRSFSGSETAFPSLRSITEIGSGITHRVADEGSQLRVEIEIPGARKEDVQFRVDEESLWIEVRREEERTEIPDEATGSATLHQRSLEVRSSTIPLPSRVEAARASSRFEAGKLVLELPKHPGAGPSALGATVF